MTVISCRWDWCRSSFLTIHALDTHVKHEHIWPMKPMRKAEIALMRRMDLQSLHSSLDSQSSIFPKGPVSPSKKTPPAVPPPSTPQMHPRPESDDEFGTFTQLSSPPQSYSPKILPVSPAFEGLVSRNGVSGLSAAVEMFERTHGYTTNRPSSGSSQEIVEQQLTQEDDLDSQSLENDVVDTELKWPTDEKSHVLASENVQDSEQRVSSHNSGSPADSTRGQNFRHGSLNVPLGVKNQSASPRTSSEAPREESSSQPLVLQTQAPYSSQALGWSQSP